MDDKTHCPRCKKPASPAELNAYHRCEDCWVGTPAGNGGSAQSYLRHAPAGSSGQRVLRAKVPY
jgi:hypothetical protein